jgi:hypothetical protein
LNVATYNATTASYDENFSVVGNFDNDSQTHCSNECLTTDYVTVSWAVDAPTIVMLTGLGLTLAGFPVGAPIAVAGAAIELCAWTATPLCLGAKLLGVGGSVTLDRYGNVFWAPLQISWGKTLTPFIGAQVDFGTILDDYGPPGPREIPTERESISFLEGTSLNVALPGIGATYSPFAEDTMSLNLSAGTTIFSASWTPYAFRMGNIGLHWP